MSMRLSYMSGRPISGAHIVSRRVRHRGGDESFGGYDLSPDKYSEAYVVDAGYDTVSYTHLTLPTKA